MYIVSLQDAFPTSENVSGTGMLAHSIRIAIEMREDIILVRLKLSGVFCFFPSLALSFHFSFYILQLSSHTPVPQDPICLG